MIPMNEDTLRQVREFLESEFDARPTQAQIEETIDFFNDLIALEN